MAFIHSDNLGWHNGEKKMHKLMDSDPHQENPTSPFLTPGGANLLRIAPLLAIGTLDQDGRPWTTVLGGERGFVRSIGSSVIGIRTLVDRKHDPVIQSLLGGRQDGEIVKEEGGGREVAGLSIDLMTRRRVKLEGRMVAGAIEQHGPKGATEKGRLGEMQLVIKVESSLGNCPKYLNRKEIRASLPDPKLISDSLPLPDAAVKLLDKADLFFISSSDHGVRMSTNHRGGPPGFVRVVSNTADSLVLAYPEYSGNRFYQTLGNMQITPQAGLVIPDFDTGDVIYVTGTTEILVKNDAAALIPHSNLVVKLSVTGAQFVQRGLPFRGELNERSPYNPPVRYLSTERAVPTSDSDNSITVNATLLKRELLTPTIARFRFSISDPAASGGWKPGQYVALSFKEELGMGYSHMRDDDPKSLNDDYIRTFTVSSPPLGGGRPNDEFEITIRNVGVVTNFLFRVNERAGLEIPLKGFGGDFVIEQGEGEVIPVVVGGIGITPLLGQLSILDLTRVKLFWTINANDIGLVTDAFEKCLALAPSTRLFISGATGDTSEKAQALLEKVEATGMKMTRRRLAEVDLQSDSQLPKWYICTGTKLKASLLQWLAGKEIVYEDFNY